MNDSFHDKIAIHTKKSIKTPFKKLFQYKKLQKRNVFNQASNNISGQRISKMFSSVTTNFSKSQSLFYIN